MYIANNVDPDLTVLWNSLIRLLLDFSTILKYEPVEFVKIAIKPSKLGKQKNWISILN